MRKKVLLGSLSGVLQVTITSILIFITITLFVEKLGVEQYGIFSLFAVIGNFNLLFNFGFNTSLIKYLVEQKKCKNSNYDIVTVAIVFIFILSILCIVILFNQEFIIKNIFGISSKFINAEIKILFTSILFSTVIVMLAQIPAAVIDSLQKTYLTNLLQLFYQILNKSTIIAILFINPKLYLIGLYSLATTMIWFAVLLFTAIKEWNYFEISNYYKNIKSSFYKHFNYGLKIYGSNILGFLYEPLTKVLINQFIGLREVAIFEIAMRIKGLFWSLLERLLYPLTPLIGKIENNLMVIKLISAIEKKLLLIGILFTAISVSIISQVIELWIGKEIYLISLTSIAILTTYMLFSTPIFLTYQFLIMKGHPEKVLKIQLVNVLMNYGLIIIMVPYLQYWGIIIPFCLAIFCSFILILRYRTQLINSRLIENKNELLNIALLVLSLLVANIIITNFHFSNLMHITLTLILNFILFLFISRSQNIFTSEDLDMLFGNNNKMKNIIGNILIANRI
ncbi:MAG: oligosaccharide flippase family protein [Bacteroidetes bacterium]|nr:oligosaccharide flippase family protein [Bacteroidota bacterium]